MLRLFPIMLCCVALRCVLTASFPKDSVVCEQPVMSLMLYTPVPFNWQEMMSCLERQKLCRTTMTGTLRPRFQRNFRSCFKAAISQQSSVQQIATMLIVDNHSVTSAFGEVCTALLLFLTIPVTVATAERSFSKLKMIKTHLRSSMGQERLSGLPTLSIESIRARELNISEIVEDFAQRKARRMPF